MLSCLVDLFHPADRQPMSDVQSLPETDEDRGSTGSNKSKSQSGRSRREEKRKEEQNRIF